MSDIQRSQLFIERLFRSQSVGHWALKELVPPTLGADGAIHVYVDPVTGDDSVNTGLDPSDALRTLQAGVDLANEYAKLQIPCDVVVEVGNGTYAEDVVVDLRAIPFDRRFIIRGDVSRMTVVAQGTCAAGTSDINIVYDPNANFGSLNELVGLTILQFDPLNRAATERYMGISSHTPTQLRGFLTGSAGPGGTPQAGWTYQVLRPAAIVSGNPAGAARAPAMSILMPWSSSRSRAVEVPGPKVILAWLQLDNADASVHSLHLFGGDTRIIGCMFEGTDGGINVKGGVMGNYFAPAVDDPVFNVPALVNKITSRFGIKPTAASKVGLVVDASFVNGIGACTALGGVLATDQSRISISNGGAIYGGPLIVEESSTMDLFSSNANNRQLFQGQGAGNVAALLLRQNATCRQSSAANGPTEFKDIAASQAAIRLESGSVYVSDGVQQANNVTQRLFDVQGGAILDVRETTSSLPHFHQALTVPENPTTDFVNAADPHDLATLITLVNQQKARINLHLVDAGAGLPHANPSANTITSADAVDLATAITLVNEIKADFNIHRTEATVHVNNDTLNIVALANATDLPTALALAFEITRRFNTHAIDTREIRADGALAAQGLAVGTASGLGSGAANPRVPISGTNSGARAFRRAI
jgi:hypothetical protein